MLMYAVAITTQSDDVNVPKNNAPQATKKTNSFLLIHLALLQRQKVLQLNT